MPAPPRPPAGDEPVDAATVLLLRDAPRSRRAADELEAQGRLEVLMVERHVDSAFAGGALVFPGGKVDDTDRMLDPARWTGPTLPWWRSRLGTSTDADTLGLLTAAVRECFEEAGVLLATREDGSPLDADDLRSHAFVEARRRLNRRGSRWDWRRWLDDEGLSLSFGALAPWSWWRTPPGETRRFDTRFLVAMLPSGQVAHHDGVETTSLRWTTPQAALDAHEAGEATVIFPTRRNLRDLLHHSHAEDVVRIARASDEPTRRIEPRLVRDGGRTLVQHPDGGPPEPV